MDKQKIDQLFSAKSKIIEIGFVGSEKFGSDIIRILESDGASNPFKLAGKDPGCVYYVDSESNIIMDIRHSVTGGLPDWRIVDRLPQSIRIYEMPEANKALLTHIHKGIQTPKPKEMVDHPGHYNQGEIECIDAMVSAYGMEAVMNFCKCSAFKYQWRMGHKDDEEQEAGKIEWYNRKYLQYKKYLEKRKKGEVE